MALSYMVILRLTAKLIQSFSYLENCLSCLQSALQAKPMRIVLVVLFLDTWEICLLFCKKNLN